jgi:hypothetical protein
MKTNDNLKLILVALLGVIVGHMTAPAQAVAQSMAEPANRIASSLAEISDTLKTISRKIK